MKRVIVAFLTGGFAFRGSNSGTEGRKVRTGSLERGLRGKTLLNDKRIPLQDPAAGFSTAFFKLRLIGTKVLKRNIISFYKKFSKSIVCFVVKTSELRN